MKVKQKLDEQLLSLLPVGADDPITARELQQLLNLPRVRDVSLLINLLRRQGEVICSNGKGYYKPATRCEVESFVKQMRSRMKEIKLATISAEKALRGGEDDERG